MTFLGTDRITVRHHAIRLFWLCASELRPIARALWQRVPMTQDVGTRTTPSLPLTVDFTETGEILDVGPDIRWLARHLASPAMDEAKLIYLGTTLAGAKLAPGDCVVAVLYRRAPTAAFLRLCLVALAQTAPVVVLRKAGRRRSAQRREDAAGAGRAGAGLDQRAPVGDIGLLVLDPGADGVSLEDELYGLTSRVRRGGYLFVLHRSIRDRANPDVVDAFLKHHPEFELVHQSYFAVIRRWDRAPRRKLRALPILDLAPVAPPEVNEAPTPDLVAFTVKEACLCLNLDQCNLRCIMCWTTYERDGNRGRYGVVDLPRDRLLALLEAPELERTTLSVVGGGEPFVYPHLADLLRAGPTENRRLMIMTNGTLLHEHDEFWRAAERAPITLTFSVDAATAATYEKIRPPGKWDVLVRNIERFVALRERNPLLRVQTSYVILRQNLAEIPEFMLLNLRWGAGYIHFHPAIRGAFPPEWLVDPFDVEFVRTMATAADVARAHGIALDRPEELVPARFVSGGRIVTTAVPPALPSHSRAQRPPGPYLPPGDPRRSCTLHSTAMTINHLGDVFVCDTAFRVRYRCGNVFTDGIQGAWLSHAWVSLRRAHKQERPHLHPLCRHCLLVQERTDHDLGT